jgi:16S rRNA (cytosine1402-N4)-methyltransferase
VIHRSVLSHEVVELLNPAPGALILDCTLGGGGHAELLLERARPDGRLIGIDRDPDALTRAAERLQAFGPAVRLIQGNFADAVDLVDAPSLKEAKAVLVDLGVSSFQMDAPARGFSFRYPEAPLDMRMHPEEGELRLPNLPRDPVAAVEALEGCTAAQIVNAAPEAALAEIFRSLGELRDARRLARAIVARRADRPYVRVGDLLETLESVLPRGPKGSQLAAQAFQALRIAVNGELRALDRFLATVPPLLSAGARIAMISFHSLEDRRVKHSFKAASRSCICPPAQPRCTCGGNRSTLRLLTPRAVRPSATEVQANPRARSALLRAAEVL